MRRLSFLVLATLVTLTLGACASTPEPAPPSIPAGTPLSKITEGMGQKQVRDIMGQPNDTKESITGKSFNPFHFGGDNVREIWYYKGVGRVIFSDSGFLGGEGMRVRTVEYDPKETGYSR